METEKNPARGDDKRVYRRPQLSQFGAVANVTRVNQPGDNTDNELGQVMGPMIPPGIGS